MNTKYYTNSAQQASIVALLVTALLFVGFFAVEPRIGQAVDDTFTIQQTITGEISFLVATPDVTMDGGGINGVTGGTSNGTTTAVVTTNSSTGYNMTIAFEDNAGDSAMYGDTTASDAIHDYTASSSEPTYGFHTASTSAVFGYSVFATDVADADDSFKDNGAGVCGSGTNKSGVCWMEPTPGAFTIVDRSTSANTGATTTLNFRVYVPNSPSPAVVTDTYTATATLTAVNQ